VRLDGDATLALEVHVVEHLLRHLALRKRAGQFEQAIRQRRLSMIDVCDDRKITNAIRGHEDLVVIASDYSRSFRILTNASVADFVKGPNHARLIHLWLWRIARANAKRALHAGVGCCFELGGDVRDEQNLFGTEL
jgi:hypothetical protein